MRRLNSLSISPDGTYATIGGGSKVKETRDKLWDYGKWTVHGMCECPGVTAVALGGGHGILQGRYGLGSDQIVSLNFVLANGTAITVSESKHPALFWAMQGAGHNFGVVTSLKYKIYDVPDTKEGGRVWSHEAFVWQATEENVKRVFGVNKEMLERGEQPDGVMLYGLVTIDPAVSPKPVIIQHGKTFSSNNPSLDILSFKQMVHKH
jgi:FAD/FMN-containing dehydrogenase